MSNLSSLSADDLGTAEAACELLLDLHRKQEALGPELAIKLDTLLNDIRMMQEDRHVKRQQRAAEATERAENGAAQ